MAMLLAAGRLAGGVLLVAVCHRILRSLRKISSSHHRLVSNLLGQLRCCNGIV